jgi:hypothetical protein
MESAEQSTAPKQQDEQHVILFYKYHPLSKDRETAECYRSALEHLCQSLELQGRILVGCNEHQSEGINESLSGNLPSLQAFTYVLTRCRRPETTSNDDDGLQPALFQKAITIFWEDCSKFYQQANCDPLVMDPSEFKWSRSTCSETEQQQQQQQVFPDLNIKLVNELIGTGGVLFSKVWGV